MTSTLPARLDIDDEPGPGTAACLRLYRKLAAGVAIVTSTGVEGPVGLTASSVTSVSLHPPALLVCLAAGSRTLAAIRTQRAFAVHLLRDDQHVHARTFADPTTGTVDRFAGLRYHERLGVPVLADTLAWSVCFVVDEIAYGDHCVVLGQVAAAEATEGRPLLWHDRSFGRFETPPPAAGSPR